MPIQRMRAEDLLAVVVPKLESAEQVNAVATALDDHGLDHLTIVELDPGRRFLERSTMLSIRRWEHERTLVERDGGCEVTDRVTFQMRPPLGWLPGAHALIGASRIAARACLPAAP